MFTKDAENNWLLTPKRITDRQKKTRHSEKKGQTCVQSMNSEKITDLVLQVLSGSYAPRLLGCQY